MKLVKNKIIPFSGFKAMALYGFLFYKGSEPSMICVNHEEIHEAQALDFCKIKILGYTIFYILYLLFWLIKLFTDFNNAYRGLCFEKEAYDNLYNLHYLETRKRFSWIKYF